MVRMNTIFVFLFCKILIVGVQSFSCMVWKHRGSRLNHDISTIKNPFSGMMHHNNIITVPNNVVLHKTAIIRNSLLSTSAAIATSTTTTTNNNPFENIIPTLEQLSSDNMMKQLSYADFIINVLLVEDNNREIDVVMKRLRAQLSHPDGIRGFMITYLTGNNDENSKNNNIPSALMKTLKEIIMNDDNEKNRLDIIQISCMNSIMPIAMTSIYKNKQENELSIESYKTSQNALQLLKSLYNELFLLANNDNNNSKYHEYIKEQVNGIISATSITEPPTTTTTTIDDNEIITFWNNFMNQWGYEEQQRKDIAHSIRKVLIVE